MLASKEPKFPSDRVRVQNNAVEVVVHVGVVNSQE